MSAEELAKEKEELGRILAAAQEEVDREPVGQQSDQEQDQGQDSTREDEELSVQEEPLIVQEEDEGEERRRSSVSTIELGDTEAHILPSASFLGKSKLILPVYAKQCYGSGSGIRCFLTPRIRDPDPGWSNGRIRIRDPG
jgi:hypothetical protein